MFGKNLLKNCDLFLEKRTTKRTMSIKQEQSDESEEVGLNDVIVAVKELEKQM